jgi:hypothetical protein
VIGYRCEVKNLDPSYPHTRSHIANYPDLLMCYFIIISCKTDHQQSLLQLLANYHLKAIAHFTSLQSLHPKDTAFWLTDGFCSCSLYSYPHLKKQAISPKPVGLSRSLLNCFENQTLIHRVSLWVQWGDRLPSTLKSPHKLTLAEAIANPVLIEENRLYDLIC